VFQLRGARIVGVSLIALFLVSIMVAGVYGSFLGVRFTPTAPTSIQPGETATTTTTADYVIVTATGETSTSTSTATTTVTTATTAIEIVRTTTYTTTFIEGSTSTRTITYTTITTEGYTRETSLATTSSTASTITASGRLSLGSYQVPPGIVKFIKESHRPGWAVVTDPEPEAADIPSDFASKTNAKDGTSSLLVDQDQHVSITIYVPKQGRTPDTYWVTVNGAEAKLNYVLPEGVSPSELSAITVEVKASGYGVGYDYIGRPSRMPYSSFSVYLLRPDGSTIPLSTGSLDVDIKRTFTSTEVNMTKLFYTAGGGVFVPHYYLTIVLKVDHSWSESMIWSRQRLQINVDYLNITAVYTVKPGAYELMFSLGPTGHLFISEAWIPILIAAGLLIIIPPDEKARKRKRGRPGKRSTASTFQW
jgi:hypothetical protein